MKKILIAVAAVALSSSSVLAADLAARTYTKAPAYAAPLYNWTGFYIGGHIGAAFGNDNGFTDPTFARTGNDARFLGGGQIGADYQFNQNWVVGIEGQISGLDNGNRGFSDGATTVIRDRSDWLASVTGRLGYTWGPGLIYAKGGVAFRDNNGLRVTDLGGAPLAFTTNRDDTGYTVGAGLEYFFAPSWSGKVEYQYYNFDRTAVTVPATAVVGSYRDDVHTVKVGVNYHFNWGGPVVAKY